uniref:FKBP-type peptidyl-prolyl cis-trans isomerase n=1 Tax=Davidia involucrata TaxID=16924 RepID=A0A5B7B8I6_DAVIN
MATVPSSTLQLSNPLFSSLLKLHAPLHAPKPLLHLSFTVRATSEDSDTSATEPSEPDSFENRLSQVRLRYRSGTGKKAEARKGRKTKKGSPAGIYLPPVPLKEPASGGLKVEFGFSPYSERVNGRIAILGLSALLLVELATGKSVISYHSPSIVFLQVYFVAAVSAMYVKYEKERVSVWPPSSPAGDK